MKRDLQSMLFKLMMLVSSLEHQHSCPTCGSTLRIRKGVQEGVDSFEQGPKLIVLKGDKSLKNADN